MCDVPPILEITDGTTTVDLLPVHIKGLHAESWTPSSALSKISRPNDTLPHYRDRAQHKENTSVVEVVEAQLRGSDTDDLIRQIKRLEDLLEQASSSFVRPNISTVYMTARWPNETNTRYAVILEASFPNLGNVIGQPLIQVDGAAVMSGLQITFRRYYWQNHIPGTDPPELPFSVHGLNSGSFYNETFGPGTLGNGSSYDIVYRNGSQYRQLIGTHELEANFAYMFGYDDSAATYTSNLLDPGTDWAGGGITVFGSPATANDAVLFGVASGGLGGWNECLVPMLVWYLDQELQASSVTWELEYTTAAGPTWTTLTKIHHSDPGLDQAGVNAIHIQKEIKSQVSPVFPAPATVNSTLAYWFRIRIASISGHTQNPTFGEFAPYCPSINYVEVQASDVVGDLPSPIRVKFHSESEVAVSARRQEMTIMPEYSKMYYGVRSMDRGESFNSTFITSDRIQDRGPSSIDSEIIELGQAASWVDSEYAVTFRAAQIDADTTNDTEVTLARVFLDTSVYAGSYRAFLEVDLVTNVPWDGYYDVFLYVAAEYDNSDWSVFANRSVISTKAKHGFNPAIRDVTVMDMGEIIIPSPGSVIGTNFAGGRKTGAVSLVARGLGHYQGVETEVVPLNLHRIVLIPTDEGFGVVYGNEQTKGGFMSRDDNVIGPNGLIMDQTVPPTLLDDNPLHAATFLETTATSSVPEFITRKQYSHWGNRTLTPGKKQRIYFLPVHIPFLPTVPDRGQNEHVGSPGHVEIHATSMYRVARGSS